MPGVIDSWTGDLTVVVNTSKGGYFELGTTYRFSDEAGCGLVVLEASDFAGDDGAGETRALGSLKFSQNVQKPRRECEGMLLLPKIISL